MDEKQARDLANEVVSFLSRGPEAPDYPQESAVALQRLAMERVPDHATAAVLGRLGGRTGPQLAAVSVEDRVLYLLDPLPRSQAGQHQRARCSMVPILPEQCSVSFESSTEKPWGDILNTTDWTFAVGETRLEFRSEQVHGTEPSDAEAFALALAKAIGTPVNTPAATAAPFVQDDLAALEASGVASRED